MKVVYVWQHISSNDGKLVVKSVLAMIGVLIALQQNNLMDRQTQIMIRQDSLMVRQDSLMRRQAERDSIQGEEIKKQTREMIDQNTLNRALVIADTEQVSLNREQVSIYRSATRMENRAYVMLERIQVPQYEHYGRFNATLINMGRTPAYDVACICSVKIETYPSLAGKLTLNPNGGWYIGPGDKMTVPEPIWPDEDELIRSGIGVDSLHYFLYISVAYKDIFGDTHTTNIARRFVRGMGSESPSHYVLIDKGNNAN